MPRNRDDNNVTWALLSPPSKTFFSFTACFHAAVRSGIRKRGERSRRDRFRARYPGEMRGTDDARRGGGCGKYAKLVEMGRKSFARAKDRVDSNITEGLRSVQSGTTPSLRMSRRRINFLSQCYIPQQVNLEYLQIVFRCCVYAKRVRSFKVEQKIM